MTLTLSGLEWYSLAAYMQWIEGNLSLKKIDINKVWSVRVKASVGELHRQKCKLVEDVKCNCVTLKEFMSSENLAEEEKAVCGSMVCNYDYYLEVLTDQLLMLERVIETEQASWEYYDIDPGQEPLF